MSSGFEQLSDVPGFSVPVHRALTEPILLGGASRSIAILNGTLSRDALFYDGSVDDAAKIAAKHAELTALGIVIRDSA